MLFLTLSVVIFYFQASYAMSIDSTVALDQLIKSSVKQNRPVILIMDAPKSLGLPDFSNDDSEHEVITKDAWIRHRDRRQGIEDCKEMLRSRINEKCNKEAKCKKVIWKVAKGICEDDN